VTIVSPEEDGSLDPDDAVIIWTHPQPSQLAGFEVIVENVTSGVPVATYILSAAATAVQVPAEAFAGPGNKYKVEVLAIDKSDGNKTIVEHAFTTQ
jgi:phosphoribosyl 1,2-cyclic phosphodiesterase